MADFLLRHAQREDFPAIRGLIHAGHINPTGLDWRRFIVAVTPQGSVIGCGQVKPHKDGSYELASIVVDARWRGQGVARVVIESLLDREPVRPLYLICRAGLKPFYEKFGFRRAAPEELTPYFRAIRRLGRLLSGIRDAQDGLTIMRLDK